jgi:hypothetical protein
MSTPKVDWIVLHNGRALCQRCGESHPFNELMPMPMPVVLKLMEGYAEVHQHCKPGTVTYSLPVPSGGTIEQRAQRWIENGHRGMSSETIYGHMTGRSICRHPSPPWDPSDFGRCRELLDLIPEWRARIAEMATVHGWERLALAWDELDAFWNEECTKKMAPKLYARMQELTR